MADSTGNSNAILGDAVLSLKIRDLKSADALARQIIETKGSAERIWKIDIDTKDEEEEQETKLGIQPDETSNDVQDKNLSTQPDKGTEAEEINDSPKSTKEERLAAIKAKEAEGALLALRLCDPLIQILTGILSHGGHLRYFSWRTSYYNGTSFTRPHTFWAALFAHSLTLETLHLDYFEHEVHQLPPPTSSFPTLKNLALNAASAHGDNGTGIEGILKSCPNLEVLDFTWPGCDLATCQIQNITWNYTFPALTRLDLNGYNFAPAALATFLSRHTGIETLCDAVDDDTASPPLAPTSLPNLKALQANNVSLKEVASYFNEPAWRPIRHLALNTRQCWNGRPLLELAKLPRVKTQVKVLELHGDVLDWREEVEEESSSDEEGDKEPCERPPRIPAVLKDCLAEFEGLRELGVGLASDRIYYTRPDGVFGEPDPATGEDVKYFLAHIPLASKIRALRLWDARAERLPHDFLDDFPAVPDSLEYFAWEGKERSFYKLERAGGRVKAVLCEEVRKRQAGEEKDDWTEKRILDY